MFVVAADAADGLEATRNAASVSWNHLHFSGL